VTSPMSIGVRYRFTRSPHAVMVAVAVVRPTTSWCVSMGTKIV
jgi:hypothetical protein